MIRRLSRLTLATGAAVAAIAAASGVPLGAVSAQASTSNLFASVNLNGTLAHGSGVSSVTHFGTGRYEVTFAADVARCAYVATTINAHSQALQVFTAGGHLSAAGVYVETKNQGGGLTDGPFSLAVDCGAPGWDYAVVGYAANLVRATAGTTLAHLGAGRYDLTVPAGVGTAPTWPPSATPATAWCSARPGCTPDPGRARAPSTWRPRTPAAG